MRKTIPEICTFGKNLPIRFGFASIMVLLSTVAGSFAEVKRPLSSLRDSLV